MTKPTVLIICDGWGELPISDGNAIALARTPRLDSLRQRWPQTSVHASGEAVGLPAGQMGNSEVGHLTIGTGRVLMQPLQKQIHETESGAFGKNAIIAEAIATAKQRGSQLHLIGLVSDGNVHAYTGSALGLLRAAKENELDDVYVHVITDGRDTPPMSGKAMFEKFLDDMAEIGVGTVASLGGRYYGMDRDNRWERIEQAYDALTDKNSPSVDDAAEYFDANYSTQTGDEFFKPVGVVNDSHRAVIEDNDVVVFFNFRPDRARQLSHALADAKFDGFERKIVPRNLHFVTLTEYDEALDVKVAYPREKVKNSLAEVLSRHNLAQYHIAETEKYAHVTYFLNGGEEITFEGEERKLIPSPKVATYDLQPEMSAREVAVDTVKAIESGKYDFVVANFANADMVGHTGILDATIKAIETLDECVANVIDATVACGGTALMTADHGNAEIELDEQGGPVTSHTTSPVPLLVCGLENTRLAEGGTLADIAPTILAIMGLEKPAEMTGHNLIRT